MCNDCKMNLGLFSSSFNYFQHVTHCGRLYFAAQMIPGHPEAEDVVQRTGGS